MNMRGIRRRRGPEMPGAASGTGTSAGATGTGTSAGATGLRTTPAAAGVGTAARAAGLGAGPGAGLGASPAFGPGPASRIRTGLRWQLSAAIALVGTLMAVALSLVVHNAARVSMLDNSRDLADQRIQVAQRMYESGRPLKSGAFGVRVDDPGLPRDLMAKVTEGRRATYVSEGASGVPDIWAAVPLQDGRVLSLHTRFTDRNSTVIRDLDQALVIGSITVVFGGSALGVLIGGQMSRRLRKAADAANQVAKGETDVRVQDAIGGVLRDETAELARAVDAMADTLRQRIEAERRVTADIAHELRTPVTGLLTAAELLPPGRPSELVRDRAQAMRTLVEDVLEVARLDGASERAELQDIMLGEFVARRVAAKDAGVRVQIVHESEVTTDPRRLERVLLNLLANAAKHGKPPIEVSVEGRVIRVRDHGPGFPEDLLADGPRRFRTGASDRAGQGHGLGLTIAAGQARVLGARLTFRNVRPAGAPDDIPAEGAVAVLWLPEHAPTNTGSYPMLPLSGTPGA
ncbi:HAMP domain-containing sensor histidine kinase [Streptomyces ipomoeae]|uniref:Sensor protein CseC n=1 Tax=Streptomyces ipomoeae 91-03 TaxID=698759 RepID=L1KZ67_9ACTN|nr:two-component system sensor histidine kinase CseC [Streptomyces ipomoeae]EKX66126.1 ATPase/histidine kinase/DNA gyrase B/HSP90 domain protein [Streptomyces ipomoeae 91-03]MDX2700344.1 HAMP domain-containing sensor histidine kinase [Streptomyces ipomoeae]MDX2827626.1 HAMP domain-containing sensor histidine kinase [Streptomyces ipomoeae]MDX2845974.1 HAMP domain-containing sensor histidine kinase [Streptomyces ipomoeae]MDX2876327.1 HAMP domain-containing sensor histidine kinase [Streptomyces i